MAASPAWKVYSARGEYIASFKYPEDAASLLCSRGDGTQLRAAHAPRFVVWTEGNEECTAGESMDTVATTAYARAAVWKISRTHI